MKTVKFIITVICLSLSLCLGAKIKLPGILGSNMVLQRNSQTRLWGEAAPGKTISAVTSWNGKKYVTRADENAKWSLCISTADAGGPYTITISDGEELVLENVMLGEVWICGGQSNMEMPVCGFMYQPVENSLHHIVYASETPGIRMFTVPRVSSASLQEDCGGQWLLAEPRNVSSFSAAGYFFGKALTRVLGGIPVGLISANWGGSNIETWMTVESLDGTAGIDHGIAKHWKGENSSPQALYNSMIWPIRNFAAKGFIWYQGESNRLNWFDYDKLMTGLVRLWRETWGNDKMPFYYVQLAPYAYEGDTLRSLPLMIEAQYRALKEIPYSGIAATTDLGNRTCIHPQKKIEVGERLAFLALANDYGIGGLPRPAPTFKSMEKVSDERRGKILVLDFHNLSSKHEWNEPDSFTGYLPGGYFRPGGFEIAGEDRVFHKAEANLRWWENRIEVWSGKVPEPVAVRYAFCNFPEDANVITTMGQPLVPFRTDDWPLDDTGFEQGGPSADMSSQSGWAMDGEKGGIVFKSPRGYYDHIEMSGEQMSVVLRWGVGPEGSFASERSLVFPMLRTVPDDTHASLMHRIGVDIPSLLSVDGLALKDEKVDSVEINGYVRVTGNFSVGKKNIGYGTGTVPEPAVRIERIIFPSPDKPLMGEIYRMKNISRRRLTVYIPEFSEVYRTLPEKGTAGVYTIRADIYGSGTFVIGPGESVEFGAVFQACGDNGGRIPVDLNEELAGRQRLVGATDGSLVLDTPDEVIDRAFRFAKIRASESIFKTAGGYMHSPGGESYYAAIWANDQAEYVNPFFPFLGYDTGNDSAINAFRHFARFAAGDYKPIPSSIIAEGRDIWNGAGDRGDAAMIAYGASRYALARADRVEAEELWPLIAWCLDYCGMKLNAEGVVMSDTDELEGRFPAGDANLCTSVLYYDALISSAFLARELGKDRRIAADFMKKAAMLASSIEKFFGSEIEGFHTYRYYKGNTTLRSWICMPLIAGIKGRAEGTIAALTSPLLLTEDGLLTEQGSKTFWDRSTLYALRGIYCAGDTGTAGDLLASYSRRRLLGNHVPYPIEAWPEGSQRHLSAESGLYCRVVTEGMFGIRPEGFKRFSIAPRLRKEWDRMALRHIRAFGSDFDIEVVREGKGRLGIVLTEHGTGRTRTFRMEEGGSTVINLKAL